MKHFFLHSTFKWVLKLQLCTIFKRDNAPSDKTRLFSALVDYNLFTARKCPFRISCTQILRCAKVFAAKVAKSKLLTSGDNHFKGNGLVLWIETGTIGLVGEKKIYGGIIWAAALETLQQKVTLSELLLGLLFVLLATLP